MAAPEANTTPSAANIESGRRTLLVALIVCLVCSIIVSSTAVLLRPLQLANQDADRLRNILEVSGLLRQGLTAEQASERIEAQLVELATGREINAPDAKAFDIIDAVKDYAQSSPLTREEDLAQIRRIPKYLPVYYVTNGSGELNTLILPIYGYGLWSTMYGFLALEGDLRTVQGVRFYQHGETPGLGGEIDNPRWLAQWQGKLVFDEQWRVRITLVKGSVDHTNPEAQYQVDGLAGATMTTRGVANLLNFWLGERGFGPYLSRLRNEQSQLP